MRIDADLLIPGRGEPISGGSVIVEGDRIVYAGPAAGATGETDVHVPALMPGMWDAHAHFPGVAVADLEREAAEPVPRRAARAVADLAATLDAGVTSVREVGGLGIELRHVVDEGTIPGPRVHAAGRILSTTGGHSDVHGFPSDWLDTPHRLGIQCDGVPECLRAVRQQLRAGAAVIKVCASGGVMSEIDHPIHQQFSDEELKAIVDEAGRADRVVAAHCHGKPGIMAALRAGATTIEHGSYLDEEAAEAMVEAGAILVPTRFILDELLQMEGRIPAYGYRKAVMVAEHHTQAMKIAVAAGVRIAMGTDIFVSGSMYGRNSREVRLLIEAGMTPLQAIEAATAMGPETLGPQAPRSGVLRDGYDADLVAFDTDPIADLEVWGDPDRVTHVWKAGRLTKAPGA